MTRDFGFAEALHAGQPCPELAEKLMLYGWLIGGWTMRARLQPEPGKWVEAAGTIDFGWILEGRAIQDVWNLPGWFHGTTLRVYDPAIDAWHILWNEPFKQYFTHQIGRVSGKDIVQIGKGRDNRDIRWSFTEIRPDSFRWTGERKMDDGSWFLECDIRAGRRA